jgi:hypothetical protein
MLSKGQQIEVKVYTKKYCVDSLLIEPYYSFRLIKDSTTFHLDENFNMLVNKSGEYILKTALVDEPEKKIFIPDNVCLFTDTIAECAIYEGIFFNGFKGIFWICCDKKCDGYHIDYYTNGNKRMEGQFRKGKAIKNITYYKIDGTISSISYYNRRGNLIKTQKY